MKSFLPFRFAHPQSHRGFGLLEVILVFTIMLGASAVVFSVYESAHAQAAVSEEADLMILEGRAIHDAYARQGAAIDFTGLTSAFAVASKVIVPPQYASGANALNSYGNTVIIEAYGVPTSPIKGCRNGTNSCYAILSPVPSDHCFKLVMALEDVYPAMLSVNLNGVLTNGKVDKTKLRTQCAAADPVTVAVYGK